MPVFDAATGMQDFIKYLDENVQRAAQKGLISAAYRGLQVIQTDLIPNAMPRPPVDRGIYRAAWRVEASSETGGDVSLVNTSPHAPVIEYGARAEAIKIGRKPLEALTEWAKRKGLTQSTSKPSRSSTKGPKNPKAASDEDAKMRDMVDAMAGAVKAMKADGTVVKKKTGSVLVAVSETQARAIAWAILKSMQKHGIFRGVGLRIGEQAAKRIQSFVEKEVKDAIAKEFG